MSGREVEDGMGFAGHSPELSADERRIERLEGALIARDAECRVKARALESLRAKNVEIATLAKSLLDFIDAEGPPAREWQAITEAASRLRASIEGVAP